MQLKQINIADYEDYPLNYNEHPRNQIEELKKSIQQFGQVKNVVVWRGYFLAGHGFKTAALELGIETLEAEDKSEWDEDTAKAFLIADNETARMAIRNDEVLGELLKSRSVGHVPGIDNELMDGLLDGLGKGEKPKETEPPQVDKAGELQAVWGVKTGDIYRLGDSYICCCDSLEKRNIDLILELAGVKKVDALWSDAPYGMNLNADFSGAVSALKMLDGKGIRGGNKYKNVIGDNLDFDPRPLMSFFQDVKEQFWWGADYYAERIPDKNEGSWFVWDKRLDESADRMYGSTFELCWSKSRHKRDMVRIKWAGVFGTEKQFDNQRYHPTQKPDILFQWFMEQYLKEGGVIFDPFTGAGCSIIGAYQLQQRTGLNYSVLGCEILPDYVAVTLQRFQDLTGQTPKLIKNIAK